MNALPKGFQAAARAWDNASPAEPDYLAEQLHSDYRNDDAKVLEACTHVFGFMDYDPAPDLALCMTGHPDDQDARDLRFARELRRKVEARLEEMAAEAAESERLAAEDMRAEFMRRYG